MPRLSPAIGSTRYVEDSDEYFSVVLVAALSLIPHSGMLRETTATCANKTGIRAQRDDYMWTVHFHERTYGLVITKSVSVFSQNATLPLSAYVSRTGFPCCNAPPH